MLTRRNLWTGGAALAACSSLSHEGHALTLSERAELLMEPPGNRFPAIPTNELVAHWPMDDAHVAGSTIADVAGSFSGTADAGVTSGGYKRNLKGSAMITLPGSPVANFANPHSVFFWGSLSNVTALGGSTGSQTFHRCQQRRSHRQRRNRVG